MTDAASLTMLEAAQTVLAQRGSPMRTSEIWETIAERGLHRPTGMTPEASLYSLLIRASLGQRTSAPRSTKEFYKAGEGIFGLVEWLDDAHRAQLEELEQKMREAESAGGTDAVVRRGVGVLEDRLEAMRMDAEAMAYVEKQTNERLPVRETIRTLLKQFLDDRVDLVTLRSVFDQKSRSGAQWESFGLGGMSGAMFLNTLLKHLPSHADEIESSLHTVLALPPSDAEARTRMSAFHSRLVELMEVAGVSRQHIQPSRVPFFVSTAWHLEDLEKWPIYYESMRNCLREVGLFQQVDNPIESYFRFVDVVRETKKALGLTAWEFERLCDWEPARATSISTPSVPPTASATKRVWLLSPGRNADHWESFRDGGFAAIGWDSLGDLSAYDSLEEVKEALRKERKGGAEPTQDALACWEFAREMKPGDEVFAKKGRTRIVGYGVVKSAYEYVPTEKDFHHRRRVEWLWCGEVKPRERALVMKTLTDITNYAGLVTQLRESTESGTKASEHVDDVKEVVEAPTYGLGDATAELFRSSELLQRWVDLLLHRKNVVLQGPPGVGKTFVAQRLAYLLVGRADPDNVRMVQFHPSYAYEDFVQGYRPAKGGGFERRDGPFLDFCDKALQDPEDRYVLVIDEINRGNLAKIFGELLMLLEGDKRDRRWGVKLAYSEETEEPFHVPPNLYVIGTMNSADRSLALVDYALRRRFAFVPVEPAFDVDGFEAYLTGLGASAALIARVRARVRKLNQQISDDKGLGRGYQIGHSYFCSVPKGSTADDAWYERIVRHEIEPLLEEYWFDRAEHVTEAVASLLADD
jgi:hypothetical protein